MSYRDREPDMETESLRAWSMPKDDEEGKEFAKEGFEIEYEGDKISLCGFTKGTDKETGKVVFAYKFKNEDKHILYYLASKDEKTKEIEDALKMTALVIGYSIQNIDEMLKNIHSQKHTFDKLGEKK